MAAAATTLPPAARTSVAASRRLPPLVMTSGNISDEPLVKDNADAVAHLGSIADAILLHDRRIRRGIDDSVAQADDAGEPVLIRRARGELPRWRPRIHLELPCAPVDNDVSPGGNDASGTGQGHAGAHPRSPAMILWPHERFELTTSASPSQATALLAARTQPRNAWAIRTKEHRTFEGEVGPDGFNISRYIRTMNLFVPVIEGEIAGAEAGSRVSIRLRPGWFYLSVVCLWMLGLSSVLVVGMVSQPDAIPALTALVLILSGNWAVAIVPFWKEVRKVKCILKTMFPDAKLPESAFPPRLHERREAQEAERKGTQ